MNGVGIFTDIFSDTVVAGLGIYTLCEILFGFFVLNHSK
jgi:hypothetical protein